MAMRIVAETARLMGAPRLIPIESAHIDGALYHGDSGTLFAERLVAGGAKTAVRATLNVGAIDLTGCSRNRLPPHELEMAGRMMTAYQRSAANRPGPARRTRPVIVRGSAARWRGANRTRSCSATRCSARAPIGTAIFSTSRARFPAARPTTACIAPRTGAPPWSSTCRSIDPAFLSSDLAWPVLGNLYGRLIGDAIGVITGLSFRPWEDILKAFGATAASAGSVGLFHVAGATPEAPDEATALHHLPPAERIRRRRRDDARRARPAVDGRSRRSHRCRRDRQPASVARRIRHAAAAVEGAGRWRCRSTRAPAGTCCACSSATGIGKSSNRAASSSSPTRAWS